MASRVISKARVRPSCPALELENTNNTDGTFIDVETLSTPPCTVWATDIGSSAAIIEVATSADIITGPMILRHRTAKTRLT